MNEFVEECRHEWNRLGVADSVADEMAAELAADLEEAEAEGASAEDVLGSGAGDARSFAAAWATERGVVQRPPSTANGRKRRFGLPAGIAGLAIIAIIGAALVIAASSSSAPRNALVSPDGRQLLVTQLRPALPAPWTRMVVVDDGRMWVAAQLRPAASAPGDDRRTAGLVLMVAGLVGVLSLTILSVWTASREVRRAG